MLPFLVQLPDDLPVPSLAAPSVATLSSAWVDVDGDGRLDLALVRADGRVQLLHNEGAQGFEDATERLGLGEVAEAALLCWSDFDGDQELDVFVGARSGPSHLYRQVEGTLLDWSAASGLESRGAVSSAYWFDPDADQRPDLFVASEEDGELRATLFRGLAGGFFQSIALPALTSASSAAVVPPAGGPVVNAGDAGSTPDGRAGLSSAHGKSVRGKPGPGAQPVASLPAPAAGSPAPISVTCVNAVRDQSTSGCLTAASIPTMGSLYPLSTDWFVDTLGKVGLGTVLPDARLHVHRASAGAVTADANSSVVAESNAPNYVSILSPDASERGLLFGEPSHNAAGALLYNSSAMPDGFELRGNGGQFRLGIDANGRLGLGTSTALGKLDILGGADGDGANDPVAMAIEHRLGGYRHFIKTRHDAAAGSLGNGIDFYLNNSTTPSGSSAPGVGSVGALSITASSANRLQVLGGVEVDATETSNGSYTGPMLRFGGTSSGEGMLSKRTGGGNQFGLDLFTGGASRLSITNGGNVGIGTNAPTYKLEVNGQLAAKNMPGLDYSQNIQDLPVIASGATIDVDSITLTLSAGGYLLVNAVVNAQTFDLYPIEGTLGLYDVTAGAYLTKAYYGGHAPAISQMASVPIVWVVPVSAGTKTIKTNFKNSNGLAGQDIGIISHSLSAIYVPVLY